MPISDGITNRLVGGIWLGAGIVGASWLGVKNSGLRRQLGFWGMVLPKEGTPEALEVRRQRVRIFAFFAAWLLCYVILASLF